MASPKFTIDGMQGGKIVASWTTNNRATAETIAESYRDKYGAGLLFKLSHIEQGVARYSLLKEYRP